MNKIAFVTDSTAYITKELRNHPDVYVLPLNINFNGEDFEDGVDLTTDELYTRIRTEKEVPKTSQPSVGRFAELFETLKKNYDSAVCVHISSELSGTFSSAVQGSDMTEDFHVEVIDSKCMSYAITHLLNQGIRLAGEGNTASEMAAELRKHAGQTENYILLGSLEQFYKGGRMSGAQYMLGSVLKIKPVLRIDPDGKFELFERIRSEKKAMNRLVDLLHASFESSLIEEVQIMHGNVVDKAKQLEAKIKEKMPSLSVITGEISSTIAVHAGEGTLALIWQKKS
ncbi:fatty acid-binding protein DegV [Alteribacter lacisalsi]|uniref:Fatty acid-binding protein DegV n=1 Tax=Alteribacter lacisalsi TaxID=2045244 RepID=A0A2W0HL01_9BACI|nr:DegV family protein [Alteribacter lacisalsi]PYZ97772.1 fatty acid-binding protein DegV [Alteribacter lacisalsi]